MTGGVAGAALAVGAVLAAVPAAGAAPLIGARAAATVPVADLDGRLVLDQGHVDVLSVHLDGDRLVLLLNDDTRSHDPERVLRPPDEVVLHAVPETRIELPDWVADFPPWQVLGDPGDIRWHFPDFQVPGVLWPGWSTDTIQNGVLADNEITLTMTGFVGPGELIVAHVDSSGMLAPPLWDTREPLPQTIMTHSRTHAHTNWYFTEPGIYQVTWQAAAALADGTPVASEPADYLFVVDQWPSGNGDGDPTSSQIITATIDAADGALILSIDPHDRTVQLPVAQLNETADRWATAGDLRPVTVTDTRAANPGWNVSGQVSHFTATAGGQGGFSGAYLCWTPQVGSQASEQIVLPGPAVPGLLDGGGGLASSQTLASAAGGAGTGTAILGAALRLELPTQTGSGTYTALITLTAI